MEKVHQMKRISVFEELKRLRQELEHEKRLRIEWQNKYYALEKELKEVKALLNQFLNANTPSSQLPPQFKPSYNERPEKDKRKERSGDGGPGRDGLRLQNHGCDYDGRDERHERGNNFVLY